MPHTTHPQAVKFRPMGAWIVIDPDDAPEKIGSIILPDSAREKNVPETGRVVAMGLGDYAADGTRMPMPDVAIGQSVYIVPDTIKHAVKVRAADGRLHAIVGKNAILAAVED